MPAPRKYPDELRERAIREVQTSGRPVAHVARDLGIHKEALRNRVRQAEADQGSRPDLLTSTERCELTRLRKETAGLRRADEILQAASVFFAKELAAPHEADAVINHLRGGFGVEPVCRQLDLSVSAFNARRRRPTSARRLRDERLIGHIRRVHAASGEVYGARRIHRRLRREGITAARCTIERLMREDGLEGVIRGQRRRTTVPEPSAPRPPDLVNRRFTAHRPNQLRVADLTYIRTWPGWVYSDRGSQYASIRYGERLLEAGATSPAAGRRASRSGNAGYGRTDRSTTGRQASEAPGGMGDLGREPVYQELRRHVQHPTSNDPTRQSG